MISGFWLLSTTGWVTEAPKPSRSDLKEKGPWVTTRAAHCVHEENTWCHIGGSPVWSPLTCSTITNHCRRIQFTDLWRARDFISIKTILKVILSNFFTHPEPNNRKITTFRLNDWESPRTALKLEVFSVFLCHPSLGSASSLHQHR